MPNNTNGIGHFTAENIVAVLRALSDTDGTYGVVAKQATEYGSYVTRRTIGRWISTGRKDLKACNRQTAFARFAQRYDQIKGENCRANANRNRELDRAFEILEKTCYCGDDMVVMPDGTLGDQCRQCQEIEATNRQRHGPT